jgi:DNA transposition AAA+ family ATPase
MNPTATPTKKAANGTRSQQRVSPDVFESHMRQLDDDQREILSFWYYYALERDWSQKELGRRAGVSDSALSLAFRNQYPAKLDELCRKLRAAQENLHQSVANPHFIMTALAGQMFELFDETRALQTVLISWGKKGIGKTEIAKEYKRRNNHGRTYYHRCSPAMTFGQFVTSLASSMNIPSKRHSHLRLREKIIAMLKAGARLLIIDELHELFLQKERSRGTAAVLICEFIREIFDVAECGVVLIGTRVMVSELRDGDHRAALEQLLDRGLEPVELPDKPTKSDLAEFIKHFDLDPTFAGAQDAAEIVAKIFRETGLRKLVLHLRAGKKLAMGKGETYRWPHFVAAYNRLEAITKKKPATKVAPASSRQPLPLITDH